MTRRRYSDRSEYEIGKGKPPKERQFKSGASGNPNGRPRKHPADGARRPPVQAARDVFLSEAYREVTLNEGGKPIKLPVSQAIMRAFALTALKGSAHAQKNFLSTLLMIERRVTEEHASLFGQALNQKADLEQARQAWLANGRDEMAMPLHPDDVCIDPETVDVSVFGSIIAEQVHARGQLLALRDQQQSIITTVTLAMRIAGKKDRQLQNRLEQAQGIYDEANEALPPRYRSFRTSSCPA